MATETHSERWTGGRIGRFLRRLGPTWLAGAIAAGPATMASLVVAGASYGYALLWVVLLSAVLGATGQYLAMRLGLLTEKGIVAVVEEHLGSFWAWVLVIDAVLAAGLAQLAIMLTLADVSATIVGSVGIGIAALADPRFWGVGWAVILALGLAGGGYRIAELGAKVLVSLVVLAFVASALVAPIDPAAAATGLVPEIPGSGLGGAAVAAGILGGAVHITLLTMQSYTMGARGWTERDRDIATFDVVSSMLVAFGVFSLAVFLVAASILPEAGVDPGTVDEIQAAQALEPVAGEYAMWIFLLGLWGAAVSTLGGNTIVPPYLLADKLGWERSVDDPRYRGALVAVALASAAGAFLQGAFLQVLVLVLAFGLVGTPFALAVILYLLNDPDVVSAPKTNSLLENLGGLVLFGVAAALAGEFVLEELQTATEPASAFVIVFAAAMALAIVGLAGKYARERLLE
ncbi:NRAMP family divalent metal transporter [Halopiger xanaduensis]|uniref:Natural resistance-associated macrophage protein n=1 Tax=Halopiger xanaduensis (strain DSM 18323 / JCM 14033 / SH-6) TaxID=797210 RepID=F8D5Q9_HALXS|nr:divalent metal cation transporter [Halopiger xanaduensis]AEH36481.1 natural resistance-associated macrophage protein [Halopiger xanaduensis SH-6]